MPSDSGRTTSNWMETASVPGFPPLIGDANAEVCVVGAGIAGLSTAYELVQRGRSVIVLDDNPIGGGESGRTTGHLSDALDEGYVALEWLHGAEGARLAFESHRDAIDHIEAVAREEGIACDFDRVDGYLFAPEGESDAVLDRELDACHRVGKRDVTPVDGMPAEGLRGRRALKHPGQGQFHVLTYLAGIAEAIVRGGGRICTGTHVEGIEGGPSCTVTTADGHTVTSKAVVVASNSPINDRVAVHTKLYPYRSYVVALELPTGAMALAQYWDTSDPYHYARIQRGEESDLLIVGGEDHKVGQADDAEDRFGRLEAWGRSIAPGAGPVKYRWSGQIMEPADGLAYIGADPAGAENVYIVTGDSGHGLTHGVIASRMLPELIAVGDHPWAMLYEPSRQSLRSLPTFASENANVASQYAAYLTGGDVDSPAEIAPGQGAIVREGLNKVAIYRDPDGNYHRRSAVCPHLGGIVRWNSAEKTWDCPCHGARYDALGKVVNGPSPVDLSPAD